MIKNYIIVAILSVVMIGSVIYGITETGSPLEARGRKLDQTRVENLRNLNYQIQDYFRNNGKLPTKLSNLDQSTYTLKLTKDPETNKEYVYSVVSEISYTLCATFATDSKEEKNSKYENPPYFQGSPSGYENFEHPKGYHCFNLTIPSGMQKNQTITPDSAQTATITKPAIIANCDLNSEATSSAKIKIMGLYETKDSVVFTTNRLVNSAIGHWRDPNAASASFQYGVEWVDSKNNGLKFDKTMGYSIRIYTPLGEEVKSANYIFQGNRTVIQDSRCPK